MSKHREELWATLANILGEYAQACVDYGSSNYDEQGHTYQKMNRLYTRLCDHLETMQTELQ